MADIIENDTMTSTEKTASNSKANSALTLGIIGTALGALNTVGNGFSLFGGSSKSSNSSSTSVASESAGQLYLERLINTDYVDITKQYYEGKLQSLQDLTNAFYKLDKQDVDNSFLLYKYSRDNKDELSAKIADLQSKVDVMAAVRPYQDALIDARIHDAEQRADINLFKRTCKMIEGQLVLGDTSISGYPSYSRWSVN